MATLRARLILILAICVTIQTYMTVVVVVLSAREFSAASLALFFISLYYFIDTRSIYYLYYGTQLSVLKTKLHLFSSVKHCHYSINRTNIRILVIPSFQSISNQKLPLSEESGLLMPGGYLRRFVYYV